MKYKFSELSCDPSLSRRGYTRQNCYTNVDGDIMMAEPHPTLSPLGKRAGRLFDAIPDQLIKLQLLRLLEALATPGAVASRGLSDHEPPFR